MFSPCMDAVKLLFTGVWRERVAPLTSLVKEIQRVGGEDYLDVSIAPEHGPHAYANPNVVLIVFLRSSGDVAKAKQIENVVNVLPATAGVLLSFCFAESDIEVTDILSKWKAKSGRSVK